MGPNDADGRARDVRSDRGRRGCGDTHELTLSWRDGRRAIVRADENETVLDAAERAGERLPLGCLVGACSTCTGRVLDGTVEHGRAPRALKPRHLDDGYVLLCIAEPLADSRIEVGVDVRADLVSNPWK